ncbi:hypothetical protein Btru_021747 [Bulinus truncatus]|nr:hypothetical protein Btru_021747 [Bulinus truncatus]
MSSSTQYDSYKQHRTSKDHRQPTRQLSDHRFKVDSRPTKRLTQLVDEFRIESDDSAFLEREYDRRRMEWGIRRRISIKEDRHTQKWRRLNIPGILIFLLGCVLLLVSSIHGIADNSIFRQNDTIFQLIGGILCSVGVIFMVLAVMCVHHREELIRSRPRCPSGAEQSKSEFTHKDDGVVRLLSSDSGCPESPADSLAVSFRSTHSARKWVADHRSSFVVSVHSLRRVSSDTALNRTFSKARLVAWMHNFPEPRACADKISTIRLYVTCQTVKIYYVLYC